MARTITTDFPGELPTAEAQKAMAAAGDVVGLMQLMRTSQRTDIDFPVTFELLLVAVENRARAEPHLFTDEVLDQLITLTAYLLLRGQLYVNKLCCLSDQELQQRGRWQASPELAQAVAPLLELQQHFLSIATARASIDRLRELTRQKALENARTERQLERGKRRSAAAGRRLNSPASSNRLTLN